MRLFVQLSFLLPFALTWFSASASNVHNVRRHHAKHMDSDLAVRAPGDLDMHARSFSNSRLTYYAVGLGACGSINQPGDFIVALNSAQFGSGEHCYQTITITVNGISAQAQIADECPGCPFGGLDCSEGLFQHFASLSSGVLYGDWSFGGAAAAAAAAPPPPPSPSTTWTPSPTPTPPPPTPTWTPPPPTTTWTPPPPTTTWSSSTSSSSSWSSSSASSSSSSSSLSSSTSASSTSSADLVATTAGVVTVSDENYSALIDLNQAMVYLGGFLGSCETTSQ